ncbi:MAG: B12-binding domain-containing radical SAM protein, partial [Desulfomonilaceae bacterium]
MKVLLVNSNRKSDVLAAPPIGLCYVATATERAGHDVAVVDLCFQRRPIERLRRVISEFKPQALGVSIRNIDNCNMLHPRSYLEEIRAMLDEIRKFTDACIVVGGSGASIYPKGVLDYLEADYIVVSEGEEAFPRLLDHIESGISPEQVPGVGFKRDGQYVLNPPVLTSFERARADLGRWVDLRPYQAVGSSYTIQSRRGCRHKCIYCTYNQLLEGQALRLRDPRDVVDEIEEAILRYHPRSFEFVDSVFNDPLDH